jgi:hypothetical protein
LLKADDVVFIGRPDIAEVDVPMQDEVSENFLEIHEVKTGKLVTILALLSPVNKLHKSEPHQLLDIRQKFYLYRTLAQWYVPMPQGYIAPYTRV